GSDIYLQKKPEIEKNVKQFLKRVDFLISDCERDYTLARELGFTSKFLGVFPGNGGVNFLVDKILPAAHRRTIVIKGYDDGVGKALVVIRALENIKRSLLEPLDIVVYGADEKVVTYVNNSIFFSKLNIQIFPRHSFVLNEEILALKGKSSIYIGNSISDGLPNSLIEAMGMGAFPIQSNPGDASAEIIRPGENGFLISNTGDANHIAELIEKALLDFDMRKKAQAENTGLIGMKYSRSELKQKIINLYYS
ncbi:glycosyltransferase, partial [Flavobacteriaceae bacterium]|nr:glycosyltransferase [Flavobacteriaceae bacterium]